jgi:hypothetical protein
MKNISIEDNYTQISAKKGEALELKKTVILLQKH